MAVVLARDVAEPLSRLLSVMADGECIARDCAARQARAADDRRSKRFFNAQATHERFHALLFRHAAYRLSSKKTTNTNHLLGLRRYARQLNTALDAGRWNEVVIGQQLVLENLGELVLFKLDDEMSRRGVGMERVRSIVLRQERSHHHFGTQWLETRLRDGRLGIVEATDAAERYIDLADRVLLDVAGLLEGVEADAEIYRREVRERLPDWINGDVE